MFPADVTVAILLHVPQQQRLAQCALVCRSWLAAAVAATIAVVAQPTRPAHTESLSRWLQHHGSRVSNLSIVDLQLQLWSKGHLTLDIPFSCLRQLQELHLAGLIINASNSGNSSSASSLRSGTWADLTALTSLHLARGTRYIVGDGPQVNSITSLRPLVLTGIDLSFKGLPSKGLPSLAPLTQLTCLVLGRIADNEGEVQGIGQLSHLEHLELGGDSYDIQVLSCLPLSLTHLDLSRPKQATSRATWDITTSKASSLGELTALVHLEVHNPSSFTSASFDPELLSNLVQLRQLRIGGCHLKHNRDAVEGVDRLLAVLPRLSNLQHLDLNNSMPKPTEQVQHYSALASSSALTYLDLRDCWLQENAVFYMFTGQQCSALHQLWLGAADFFTGNLAGRKEVPYAAVLSALDALVAACPALQELHLLNTVVDPDCWGQLSALEHLTGLSKLVLVGDAVHDHSIALLKSLELPALRDLKVDGTDAGAAFTADGVLPLQGFTQLTQLDIHRDGQGCEDDLDLLFRNMNGLKLSDEDFRYNSAI